MPARWPSCCQDPFPLQTRAKNTAGSVTAAWEPNLNPPELGAGGATRHLQPRGQQEGTSTSLQEGFGPSWLTKTACKLLKARQLFNSQHRPCLKYSLVHGEKEGQSTKKRSFLLYFTPPHISMTYCRLWKLMKKPSQPDPSCTKSCWAVLRWSRATE